MANPLDPNDLVMEVTVPRNLLFLGVAILLLTACATPYGERGFWGVGYDQTEIEPGLYFLDYTGDQYHSMAKVVGYWHRRARELCPNGFQVMDREQGVGPGGAAIAATGSGGAVAGLFQYPRYTGYVRCTDDASSVLPASPH